jgi:O-methyltransferase
MTAETELIDRVLPYTKQSRARLLALIEILQRLDRYHIPGDVVECGVWQGASLVVARTISPDRVVWGYDTFDGMTEPEEFVDVSIANNVSALRSYRTKRANGKKWAACSRDNVIQNIMHLSSGFGLVHLIPGDVSVTLKRPPLPEQIALLRLDTDFYKSTKAELEALWPRVVKGGVLIVDDYGHWAGSRRAVNEYFGLRPINVSHCPPFIMIDDTAMTWCKLHD